MADLPPERELSIKSSADGSDQPSRLWSPADAGTEPRPLLMCLHTWGGHWRVGGSTHGFVEAGLAHGWHCIMPNFRGRNDHPDACGSPKAVADILDAVDWALANLPVVPDRVYVTGGSGGGHMTLMMASFAPERFAAASAWCSLTDLTAWHREHVKDGQPDNYGKEIRLCLGGDPEVSTEAQAQSRIRSPIHHLAAATGLNLDINHGILDGKTGSVPIHHSIDAFNVVARAAGGPTVSQAEHDQLWTAGRSTSPQPQDTQPDPDYDGREIFLRRQAGRCRLTIHEGGHEMLPYAACRFLARFTKSGRAVKDEGPRSQPSAGPTRVSG